MLDGETEAIYAPAVAGQACKPWVVEYVFNAFNELGYSESKMALKSGAVPEIKELKGSVAARRLSPTMPLEVLIR